VDLWDYQAFHSQQKRRRKEEEKGREEKRAERKTHPTISFSQEPRKTRGKYPNVYFLYE